MKEDQSLRCRATALIINSQCGAQWVTQVVGDRDIKKAVWNRTHTCIFRLIGSNQSGFTVLDCEFDMLRGANL